MARRSDDSVSFIRRNPLLTPAPDHDVDALAGFWLEFLVPVDQLVDLFHGGISHGSPVLQNSLHHSPLK